jgi:cytoskeletal protein RodZ
MAQLFTERQVPSDPAEAFQFGRHLKTERQSRGFTLEEISQATKISVCYLEALEKEQFDRLPAPTFTKGFIRSYCHFIRLDETQAIFAYSHCAGSEFAPLDTSAFKPKSGGERVSRFVGSLRRLLG